jgi:hypothetical protein
VLSQHCKNANGKNGKCIGIRNIRADKGNSSFFQQKNESRIAAHPVWGYPLWRLLSGQRIVSFGCGWLLTLPDAASGYGRTMQLKHLTDYLYGGTPGIKAKANLSLFPCLALAP